MGGVTLMKSVARRACLLAVLSGFAMTATHAQVDTTLARSARLDTGMIAARGAMDSVFARARRLVMSGQVATGRQMGDSILASTREGTEAYGEALYGVATLAPTANDAALDYQRIIVEYPLSAHAGDALLQLAQLERSQGDRAAAIEHLDRYLRENPRNPKRATPGLWLAQLLFEQDENARACNTLSAARATAAPSDVELQNQINFYSSRCAAVAAQQAVDSAARVDSMKVDSATRAAAMKRGAKSRGSDSSPANKVQSGESRTGRYTVQLAAYVTKADAEKLVGTLKRQGVIARVDGVRKPFRVRVGYYRTRGEAAASAAMLKKAGYDGFVADIAGH
jgi:cell division protein FtsN